MATIWSTTSTTTSTANTTTAIPLDYIVGISSGVGVVVVVVIIVICCCVCKSKKESETEELPSPVSNKTPLLSGHRDDEEGFDSKHEVDNRAIPRSSPEDGSMTVINVDEMSRSAATSTNTNTIATDATLTISAPVTDKPEQLENNENFGPVPSPLQTDVPDYSSEERSPPADSLRDSNPVESAPAQNNSSPEVEAEPQPTAAANEVDQLDRRPRSDSNASAASAVSAVSSTSSEDIQSAVQTVLPDDLREPERSSEYVENVSLPLQTDVPDDLREPERPPPADGLRDSNPVESAPAQNNSSPEVEAEPQQPTAASDSNASAASAISVVSSASSSSSSSSPTPPAANTSDTIVKNDDDDPDSPSDYSSEDKPLVDTSLRPETSPREGETERTDTTASSPTPPIANTSDTIVKNDDDDPDSPSDYSGEDKPVDTSLRPETSPREGETERTDTAASSPTPPTANTSDTIVKNDDDNPDSPSDYSSEDKPLVDTSLLPETSPREGETERTDTASTPKSNEDTDSERNADVSGTEVPSPAPQVTDKPPSQARRSVAGEGAPAHILSAADVGKAASCRGRTGVLRYFGTTEFASGLWAGLELLKPIGKNDGSVRGKRYFRCKKLHGSFVRPVTVKLLDSGGLVSSQFIKDKNASPSKIKQPERRRSTRKSKNNDKQPDPSKKKTKSNNTAQRAPLTSGEAHTRVHQVTDSSAVLVVRMGTPQKTSNKRAAASPPSSMRAAAMLESTPDPKKQPHKPSFLEEAAKKPRSDSARLLERRTSWKALRSTLRSKKELEARAKLTQIVESQADAEKKKDEAEIMSDALAQQDAHISLKAEKLAGKLEKTNQMLHAAQERVQRVTWQEMDILRGMARPPPKIRLTLEGVCLMLGHNSVEWEDIRKFLRQSKFIETILGFQSKDLKPRLRDRLKKTYLANPLLTLESINYASKTAGPLFQWFEAQIQCGEVLEKLKPMTTEMDELKKDAEFVRKDLRKIRRTLSKLEEDIERNKFDFINLMHLAEVLQQEEAEKAANPQPSEQEVPEAWRKHVRKSNARRRSLGKKQIKQTPPRKSNRTPSRSADTAGVDVSTWSSPRLPLGEFKAELRYRPATAPNDEWKHIFAKGTPSHNGTGLSALFVIAPLPATTDFVGHARWLPCDDAADADHPEGVRVWGSAIAFTTS